MIVSNHQKDILYFKQYPCYSITTHLSQHRQLQFANVTYVEFSNKTQSKYQLPKFYIDKYQSPHQMYWLEWRTQQISDDVINQGKHRVSNNSTSNNKNTSKNLSQGSLSSQLNTYRCLYIALLGKMAHIKLVFNYDPQIVAICQDFIYTIGGNQLIITELWPQNIESTQQLPLKQSQVIHQLQNGSKILSLDFVYDQFEGAVCKIIYFHEKKGIYYQTYKKNQFTQSSLINKIFDFSLKFKKSQPQPLFYETLVPNILGLIVHNTKQFSLFNLTEMKIIQNTRLTLEGWQLTLHQPIVIKSHINEPQNGYHDCLNISIGQGSNIEIFLYHIMYSQKALITSHNEQIKNSQLKTPPIHMFTSGQFIDFPNSLLKHFTIIHLQQITYLSNFILNKQGVLYLGYQKNSMNDEDLISDQLPITGFVYYLKPYISHEILMQQNKIWREYKRDINLGSTLLNLSENSKSLERLLTPGRYQKWFILKTLKLNKINQLSQILKQSSQSLNQINQKLIFEWRNDYKFVEFIIFKGQMLVIRKNSIGTLIGISQQQFIQQKDAFSQKQVSYNEILSRGFSVHHDLEGDPYIDQEFDIYQHKNNSESIQKRRLHLNGKNYEDKIRSVNAMLANFMQQQPFDGGLKMQKAQMQYYDEQEFLNYSYQYEQIKQAIINLATQHDVFGLPQRSPKQTQQSMISIQQEQDDKINPQKNYIQLHVSILSLRVKDILLYWLNTLKINYHYYSNILQKIYKQQLIQNKNKITTLEDLQKAHLDHIYIVFVLEWIYNVGNKYHLQNQYQLFDHDLIQEFVEQYVQKFYYLNNCRQTHYIKFFKNDLDFHVQNILAHLFKGLLRDVLPNKINAKNDQLLKQQIIDVSQIPQQGLVSLQISKLNNNVNSFLLMLLKKHTQIQSQIQSYNKFITNDLLIWLYKPLLLEPFNKNLQLFIPINKTFVYSILSMPISKQEKKRILSCHLHKKQFLSLLLLIQLQNNCYLSIEEELQVEIYQSNLQQFQQNTIALSRQNSCIIQDLILMNYKLFLFPTQTSKKSLIIQPARSNISDKDYQVDLKIRHQQMCIKFIKTLFSNIDFKYLTALLMHEKNASQTQLEQKTQGYEKKAIAEIYRQLIQQVQQINQKYGNSKGNKIEKAFQKFYTNIYHRRLRNHNSQSNQHFRISNEVVRSNSNNYPEMTGLGYKLQVWQLKLIDKLYQKHLKILRMERKDTFESTSIIQQRLNLEFAMIKIHLFRFKIALKQLPTLTNEQKQQYVQIMKECVRKLKDSLTSFKDWRVKLGSSEDDTYTDEQIVEDLKQISQMQNSRVWDKCDQLNSQIIQQNQENEQWEILGLQISGKWLGLLQLSFSETSTSQGPFSRQNQYFTNYNCLEDILMKMLIVIKTDSLSTQHEKSLRQLFGQNKINLIIDGNRQLKILYDKQKMKIQTSQSNPYSYGRNVRLFSKQTRNTLY